MSVSEAQLKQSVQNAIKNALIDTKYHDEEVTFGQAIVTHYFLNQLQQNQSAHSQSIQNMSQDGPITQSQHLHDLTKSTSALHHHHDQGANQAVVQFDLIKQDHPEFKPKFGRKKGFGKQEATCVKEVFNWDDGNTENFRHYRLAKDNDFTIRNKLWEENLQESFKDKKIKEIERSPNKWQSEQRDQFRVFVDGKTAEEMKKPKSNAPRAETLSPQRISAAQTANEKVENAGFCQIGEHLQSNQILVGSQALMNTQQQEEVNTQQLPSAPQASSSAIEKDHHRKVRINKENIKKRPQSAKQKVKPDPTRQNYLGPTRWLPDSAFTTYFGKPAFHAYGMANVNPVVGGNIYGQYMLTHNVNPESGNNLPQYQQVYKNALKHGLQKNDGMRQPELPRKPTSAITASKPGEVVLRSNKQDTNLRGSIMPEDGPKTVAQKLGKSKVQTIKILPPAKDKVVKTKTPASNPFQIHDNNKSSPSRRSRRQSSNDSRQGGFDMEEVQTNFNQGALNEGAQFDAHPNNQGHNQDFSQNEFAVIDEHQDIGDADGNQNQQAQQYVNNENQAQNFNPIDFSGRYIPLCDQPTGKGVDTRELNPKYYQFMPACWTQRIRPAGRQTFKSEKLYDVLTQAE